MQRVIDGPDSEWVGISEACKWLGIGKTLFEGEAERESDWLRHRWFGSGQRRVKKWYWLDLVSLSNVIRGRQENAPDGATG